MQLIETRGALTAMAERLATAERCYIDTEFESTRGGAELCLVQIGTGTEVFIVDTLRLRDLSPLAAALGSPETQWVVHAGGQDIPLLLGALGLERSPTLFDTQIAWALVSAEPSVALGYLVYRLLGVRTGKAHQADDWKRRPLPPSQLAYAAADIEHLPALHAELARRAEALGRLPIVALASAEQWTAAPESPPPLSLASFRHAWQLDAPAQAGLRALVAWHNGLSRTAREQCPEPKTLFAVASRMPASTAELGHIKGVSRSFLERRGATLVELLSAARAATTAADFVPIEPEPYATFEELTVDAWVGLVRAEACARALVAPDLAFPTRLARRAGTAVRAADDALAILEPLSGWRRELLEAALREAIDLRPLPLAEDRHRIACVDAASST
ncbi:MAG: HRDC domain-containing protein [Polyangiaceae bacterium]|nr:HRDC domain-containing protein [Polyangiaceae bacterium]